MVYIYKIILLSLNKEENPIICYTVNKCIIGEINQSQKDKYYMITLI